MRRFFLFLLLLSLPLCAQEKKPLSVDDLWKFERLGNAELSPDGKTIAYTVSVYSMELNKGNSDIYLMNADGSNARPFRNSDKSEGNPKFSPDGRQLAYTVGGQIHIANLDGSGDTQVTSLSTGADGIVWSPDGKKMLFVSSVYPDCGTDECNKTRDQQADESKVKASVFTELLYRHWNGWRGEKRSHLFLLDLATKNYTDLTLGDRNDTPPIALGSAADYAFSPDGSEIAYTMNPDKVVATSTNNEIFLVGLGAVTPGTRPAAKKITLSLGNDNQPVYSPDGRFIAYTSMLRAGFEADKLRIMLYERSTGTTTVLTDKLDRSAGELLWSPDGKYLYFNAANEVNESIYRLTVATKEAVIVVNDRVNANLLISPDGGTLYFKQQRTTLPFELFSAPAAGGAPKQLTALNTARLANIAMNEPETFWAKHKDGTRVQSILLRPPFFDAKKKYPVIFLIHGGPQGNWNDEFHYRWNQQLFASEGYVVVSINPRGSTGYGQKFTDAVSGDWGGKPFEDIMAACDAAITQYPFIDANNQFAAGASYGGYMINWMAGHTKRFKALVSHAGVFNLESMYGTTEELWFTEWEFRGTPWTNRKLYEKFSPHRYINNCTTPMLVVHGGYDFRVPEEQAFQLFTSLQRLGIESKFLYFPDETHFVAKPQNSRLWWSTVFSWFSKHYTNQ